MATDPPTPRAIAAKRRRPRFSQVDLKRALKAAGEAGLKVQRFEIDPDGKIVIATGSEPAPSFEPNEWDE